MFNKTKNKSKKYFRRCCLQCFTTEEVLIKHEQDCLIINGKQDVKLEKGFISFRNYSRQIPVPSKIYADFECILKSVDSDVVNNNDISYKKNIKNIFLVVLFIN